MSDEAFNNYMREASAQAINSRGKRTVKHDHPSRVCPTGTHEVFSECDCIDEEEIFEDTQTPAEQGMIVDPEEVLDALIEDASKPVTPSLATLFQRGKDAGLIKPAMEYGGSGTTA